MHARWLSFVVWALLAASLAYWALMLMAKGPQAPAMTRPAIADGAPADWTRLFAAAKAAEAPVEAASSRYQLLGVVAPSMNVRHPGEGVALIVGAGRSGRSLLRELRETPGERVVGFVDDDPRLHRRRLLGVPVRGGTLDIERILATAQPDTVLVTIPQAPADRLDAVVRACAAAAVPCRFVRRETDLDPLVVLGAAPGPS